MRNTAARSRTVVSLGKFQLIANAFNSLAQRSNAFRGFLSCADFVVIERIIFSDIRRREIRHYDIGPGKNSFFTAAGIDSSQSCGGRKEQMVIHQPENTDQKDGEFGSSGGKVTEPGVMMRDKGPIPVIADEVSE